MPEILVTESICGEAMTQLCQSHAVSFEPGLWCLPERLAAAVAQSRALIVRNQTKVTAELIAAAPRLEIIARAGVGLDNVDVEAASTAGVVVSYTPEANAVSVAELTIGLMLALARKLPAADRDTKSGGWDRPHFTGIELAGRTLGIVGFGRIGRMAAKRAKAFGMSLVACDPVVASDSPAVRELGVSLLPLDDLLAAADVVSCHVPLTPATMRLFDANRFDRMKPGAFFVNTSRGEIVDEPALLSVLESGRLGGAALDVRQTEPPGSTRFDQLENVILTPHVGSFTAEAQRRTIAAVCRDVTAVLAGHPAIEFANFARPRRS